MIPSNPPTPTTQAASVSVISLQRTISGINFKIERLKRQRGDLQERLDRELEDAR
jgi:hypothetical protein